MGNILLKCEDKLLKDLSLEEFEYKNTVEIYNDDVIVGQMCVSPTGDCLGLELIDIAQEYRGNGYGTNAMKQLKEICKSYGMKFIHGDSPNKRKPFYQRLGAKYEWRDEYDPTFINSRFYIDL